MKNSLLKLYMLALMLVSNFVVFAQPGSGGEGSGGPEGDDTPIDSKLIWLSVLGVAFAYAYFSKLQKVNKTV